MRSRFRRLASTIGATPILRTCRSSDVARGLIRENESLAAHSQHLRGRFGELLAEAVAEDLGYEPAILVPDSSQRRQPQPWA